MVDPDLQASTKRVLLRLMRFLYSLGIWFYGIGIRIASLFNDKAKKWIVGRKDQFEKIQSPTKPVIWFHCASLGEFDQGLPLMRLMRKEFPNHHLLVTLFSPSGMDHYAKRDHPADEVQYMPLDTRSNAKRFVKLYHPEIAIFVKYDFWANHIFELNAIGTKLFGISCIFRADQIYFKRKQGFFPAILEAFDHFFVQDQNSKSLLNSIKLKNCTVTGDTRFDAVIANRQNARANERIESFVKGHEILIFGSTWPLDEQALFPVINETAKKVIIAPHEINDKHIREIEAGLKRKNVRYTQASEEDLQKAEIMILDTIGHLATAYKYGQVAYVGGGFSGKLHNILEPAVFGLPVIFGPKHERFPEAQHFIDGGFGFSIHESIELKNVLQNIFSDLEKLHEKTAGFVRQNEGASERILAHITSNSRK